MWGNHFLETQSRVSRNRADVDRRKTPPDAPRIVPTTSCAEYFILRVEGGPTAGTIPWSVIDLDDDSTASSGTYTLGDAYTTIKSVIDTDLSTDCLILGGPLPGNGIVLHLNRGLSASRWRFKIGTASLTPQAGFGCYAVVDACCVAGG